ncbi:hypothetical protein ASPTUDRAFT_39191 [Aspergillus tubingensis CBS 134.48]|uniref:Uncharacterized protein n=1 Tax=Aspergillus tubingensis (strain CBS 134.48) TaxID=767770 RepID=A0A1L9NAL6_ASPTC|nr:hypothetical protein ASPTUDRAFT_39191 [Aspergillus tubingensis CBS 134.48]
MGDYGFDFTAFIFYISSFGGHVWRNRFCWLGRSVIASLHHVNADQGLEGKQCRRGSLVAPSPDVLGGDHIRLCAGHPNLRKFWRDSRACRPVKFGVKYCLHSQYVGIYLVFKFLAFVSQYSESERPASMSAT